MKNYWLLLLSLSISSTALAGTISKIYKKGRRVLIDQIEEGDGIEKGAKVCVYDDSDKRITCGKIAKTTKSGKAYMRISKKKFKMVKKGMIVRTKDGSSGGGSNTAKNAGSIRIAGFWTGGIMTPYSYQKLAYQVPESQAPSTLWKQEGEISTQLFGLGLSAGFQIGPGMLITGLRYRAADDLAIDSDYSPSDPNIYSSIKESSSSTGIFFDYAYMTMPLGMFLMDLTAGLDVDMSAVSIDAEVIDEKGTQPTTKLSKAESKLTVASLRVGANFDAMFMDMFGMNFGLNLLVPLSETPKYSGEVTDAQATGLDAETQGKDLEKQLAHKKSSVGVEIIIGVVSRL